MYLREDYRSKIVMKTICMPAYYIYYDIYMFGYLKPLTDVASKGGIPRDDKHK